MAGEKDDAADRGDDVKEEVKKADEAADKKGDEVKEDEGADPVQAKKDALADEDGDEKADKDKGIKIPKSRLDEVSRKAKAREKELQDRLTELEAKIQAGEKTDQDPASVLKAYKDKINVLREKQSDLVFDGKKAEAKQVQKELADLEEAMSDYKIALRADEARSRAEDTARYNAMLDKLEVLYPVIDETNEEHFDEEVMAEVATLMNTLARGGMRPHAALEKAVKYVLGDGKAVREADEALKKKRDAEARKKAAEADKKQPANLSKAGVDSDKAGTKDEGGIDVMKLNVKTFDKLSEETKAKLRGDVL